MFAFAFYLVGLDHYANAIFAEPDVTLPLGPVIAIGLLCDVALTALDIGGVQNTVKVWNVMVGILLHWFTTSSIETQDSAGEELIKWPHRTQAQRSSSRGQTVTARLRHQ